MKKNRCAVFKIFAAVAALCLRCPSALAEYGGDSTSELQLGASAMQDETANQYSGQAATDTMATHVNIKLGYVFSNGIYLGALYETTTFYANATGTPAPDRRVSAGPTLGYEYYGFFAFGTYFLSTQNTLGGGGIYSGGTAYEVEAGYNWKIGSNFYLGLSAVLENFSWAQYQINNSTTSQTNTQSNLYPALGIGIAI